MDERMNPAEVEPRWYAEWEKRGVFHASEGDPRPPFSIVIPPPNVTGILHMGHALTFTFQDVIVRWRRMQGRNACWFPGTDHAGIATQNVVEKELRKEKKTRHDLGREKFVELVWKWKEEKGGTIIRQLKRLGSSCDWEREAFTMSPELSRAVREVFVRLYEEGLIYRGKYLVNWCPRCQTALSDEEAVKKEVNGNFYYIKYPLDGGGHVTVATTRPETMLGDTAVAVNPNDPDKKSLIGKFALLPFVNRRIPVIGDDAVEFGLDPETGKPRLGSGALKVTPGHDKTDYEIGRRHNLPLVSMLEEDGKVNANGGEFKGLDRFEARKQIVAKLEALGLLEKTEPYRHEVPHCQRCDTVVEYYLSVQWFVRMQPLAARALQAHQAGEVRWHPERWAKVYERWLTEIRDWCISRQLWWGHRIPVFYCERCNAGKISTNVFGEHRFSEDAKTIVSRDDVKQCPSCGGPVLQDEDVLDTWFSSWLWPFTTMGWPEKTKTLDTFYPTDVLVTGYDIIFFWVSRMIMAGYHFTGQRPFSDVFLHGLVCDEKGEKMSKSKGNTIDPTEIIGKFSADALRYSLVMLTSEGQDCRVSEKRFEEGRNFTTKVWNAARLVLSQTTPASANVSPKDTTNEADRWVLSRLKATIESMTRALEQFRLNEALQTLYAFTWDTYCSWYLELAKPRLYGQDAEEKRIASGIACYVLDRVLRLLHPYTPFLSEELWSRLDAALGREPSLVARAKWPTPDEAPEDALAERKIEARIAAAHPLKVIRNKYAVPPKQEIEALLSAPDEQSLEPFHGAQAFFKMAANVSKLTLGVNLLKPKGSAAATFGAFSVYVPGLFDPAQEKARIEGALAKKRPLVESKRKKIAGFSEKVPAEVVEREKASLAELEAEVSGLERALAELAAG
jgi:valyl-tRNA synthetase